MNTEEKFVHPDLQALRAETSPTTLRARILTQLEKKEDSKMRTQNRFLRFSLSVGLVAVIGVGTLMMSNTANAIPRIKAALQDVSRYHVKSFHTTNGKRQLVSETWVDGQSERFVIYDANGKPVDLNQQIVDLNLEMGEKIKGLSVTESARIEVIGQALEDVKVFSGKVVGSGDVIVIGQPISGHPGDAKPGKSKPGKVKPAQSVQGQPLSGQQVIQGGEVRIVQGQPLDATIELAFVPVAMGGANGVEYLRKLLSDKELWNIERGVSLKGRLTDKYSLKEGLVNFILFVDPHSELPLLTRTTLGRGKTATTIEDEYDYVSALPKQN